MTTTTPTPAPAPMTAIPDWKPTAEAISALPEPLRKYIHDLETNCDPAGTIRSEVLLREHTVPALTARVAELERERQYTCEQHRDEVRKGERCVWCELAAARGAFDLSESERQRLAGRINATEAELAAASKVDDGEVADRVRELIGWKLPEDASDDLVRRHFIDNKSAGLLTRLSAALKEAERRETEAKTLQHELASDVTVAVARAQAAEAKLAVFETHVKGMLAEAFDDGRLRSDLVLEGEPGNGTEYAKDRISQLKEPRHD